jgi:hypothetical protein
VGGGTDDDGTTSNLRFRNGFSEWFFRMNVRRTVNSVNYYPRWHLGEPIEMLTIAPTFQAIVHERRRTPGSRGQERPCDDE